MRGTYLKKRLVILAGAGASCAVDGKQYPTTLGFREQITEQVSSNPLFLMAEAFLESQRNEPRPFDIEKILWVLKEFEDSHKVVCAAESFPNFLLRTGQIAQISGMTDGQRFLSLLQQGLTTVGSLIGNINALVYDLYGAVPNENDLRRTWIPMLTWGARNFDAVDVFTTNYDVVIEEALANIPNAAVQTGHTHHRHGTTLDVNQWRFLDRSDGLLTKLHGSVNWQYGKGGSDIDPVVRIVGPEFLGNHDGRAIIYPGYKETPSKEPFQLFHAYFASSLRSASHVVSIGFAFRDEYINGLIREVQDLKRAALVIDPSPRPEAEYPPLGKLSFLKRGFGQSDKGLLAPDFCHDLDTWIG